jgi:hypothetical protein
VVTVRDGGNLKPGLRRRRDELVYLLMDEGFSARETDEFHSNGFRHWHHFFQTGQGKPARVVRVRKPAHETPRIACLEDSNE